MSDAYSIIGGALMSFLPVTNGPGCLAGIYLVNAVVAPLPVQYAVSHYPRIPTEHGISLIVCTVDSSQY
jgi:hypothetical protein